jgi:hypothetical protein
LAIPTVTAPAAVVAVIGAVFDTDTIFASVKAVEILEPFHVPDVIVPSIDAPVITTLPAAILAENVALSVHKGQALVVTGKLKVKQWQDAEKSGTNVEIDATVIGHDLNRGTSEFTKVKRVSEFYEQDPWLNETADTEINAA